MKTAIGVPLRLCPGGAGGGLFAWILAQNWVVFRPLY